MSKIKKILSTAGLILALSAGIAAAQTDGGTPGTPEAGSGGNAALNIVILGSSALAAVAGGLYVRRKLVKA